MQKDNIKYHIHLHFLVFIAGFTAIFGKLITNSPVSIVWHRMFIALIVILLFSTLTGKKLKTSYRFIFKYSLLGFIISLHWITFFMSIDYSNVTIALSMMSTTAFFTSFIEPIFFKRKIIPYELILSILVIAAIFLILNSEFNYSMGIILGISSAFLASIFSVLNGLLIKNDKAYKISFYEFLFGVIFISIFLIITGRLDDLFIESFFSVNYLYIFLLGVVCTAYAFIAAVYLLNYITPYSAVITYNLEPIYGIILALLIFGESEQMSFNFYVGLLLILFSVFLNFYLKKYDKKIN
jgi:drug/metabolite transporter (DMT)-like permease